MGANQGQFQGSRIIAPEDQGAMTLSNDVTQVMGTTAVVISRPAGSPGVLYLAADVGSWRVRPGNYKSQTITGEAFATDTLTVVGHGYVTGDGPFRLTSDNNDLPLNLLKDTNYWIIRTDDDDFKLATTKANAEAGTVADFDDDGTATVIIGGAEDGSTPADDGYGWAAAAFPSAAAVVAKGNYSAPLIGQGFTAIIASPEKITVKGFTNTDVLSYWFA